MSGHSKWSKVKHQKATTDVVKSFAFTKAARAITIAVQEGGGITDPDSNFHLRLAIEKARDVNMPKDNIQRAIDKGKGEGAGTIEQLLYEGYGPGGVAFLIEAATDNKQRTVSQVKNVLERGGGTLASPGAVSFLFTRRGIVTVQRSGVTLDALVAAAIDAGADDVQETTDVFEVYTSPHALDAVKKQLEAKKIAIDNTLLVMHPTVDVEVVSEKEADIDEMIAQLEALDDVQTVYTNKKS